MFLQAMKPLKQSYPINQHTRVPCAGASGMLSSFGENPSSKIQTVRIWTEKEWFYLEILSVQMGMRFVFVGLGLYGLLFLKGRRTVTLKCPSGIEKMQSRTPTFRLSHTAFPTAWKSFQTYHKLLSVSNALQSNHCKGFNHVNVKTEKKKKQ